MFDSRQTVKAMNGLYTEIFGYLAEQQFM